MTDENHLKTGGEPLEFQNKLEVSSSTLSVTDECLECFHDLKIKRLYRYVIFEIEGNSIKVDICGDTVNKYEDFKSRLPYTKCRYGLYDQDLTFPDGRKGSKIWFVCWLPSHSTPHHKMAYASAKSKLRDLLSGVFDLQVTSHDELDVALGYKIEEKESDDDFDF